MTRPGSDGSPKTVILLACIPTVDCVVNQLVNGLHLYLGSVSFLHVYRAALLACLALFVMVIISRQPAAMRRLPFSAVAGLGLLLLWVSKQWLLSANGDAAAYIQYGQIAYWLLLWMAASLACTTSKQAMVLLYGLACGAILTAGSVLLGFAFGGVNYYEDDSVTSSAGWFLTAKAITGVLVCGSAVILYLGIGRRRPWLYAGLALFCLLATVLTYARTGTVALVIITAWLALWVMNRGGFFRWSALKWFLSIALVAALMTPVVLQPQKIFARWGDVTDGENAGSGRAGIWAIAMDGFMAAPLSEQIVGSGFDSMADLLYREYGEDVKHTHNDTLDLLLIGGIIGLIWQLSFIFEWASHISRMGVWSVEGAATMAVFLVYFCHAQLTGQLWGTDVMNYYLVSLIAFTVIGQRQRVYSRVQQTTTHTTGAVPTLS